MSFCTLGQLCTTGTFLSILKNLKFFAQFFRIFVAFSHCINFLDFVAKGSSFHGLVKITWMKFIELKTWWGWYTSGLVLTYIFDITEKCGERERERGGGEATQKVFQNV